MMEDMAPTVITIRQVTSPVVMIPPLVTRMIECKDSSKDGIMIPATGLRQIMVPGVVVEICLTTEDLEGGNAMTCWEGPKKDMIDSKQMYMIPPTDM